MKESINITITILTAILTGGFILIFIESQQVFTRVHEHYNFIMKPFFKSFNNYVRFVSSIRHAYIFKMDSEDGYIKNINNLVEEISKLGMESIFSGSEYSIFSFKAEELNAICKSINNIWYFVDKSPHKYYRDSGFDLSNMATLEKDVLEYLNKISSTHLYTKINEDTLPDVSGKFYVEQYQPIESYTYYYERWLRREKLFKRSSFVTILATLLSMLVILVLHIYLPLWALYVLCSLCCVLLVAQLILLSKLEEKAKHMV